MDDIRWTQGEMETTISNLETQRNEMNDQMEQIKSSLRDQLLQTGMSGSVADALLETFQKEVVEPAEQYLETAMNYITENTRVNEALIDTTKNNTNIATM